MSSALITAGPYDVVATLGQGGMGVVYLAEHRETGARVALKTAVRAGPMTIRGLRREVAALKRLNHPSIVRLIEDGLREDGAPWYAMVLLDGETLRLSRGATDEADSTVLEAWTTRLTARHRETSATVEMPSIDVTSRLEVPEASRTASPGRWDDPRTRRCLRLLAQLTHALAYLHGEGLVHCDLKPDNILVTPEDRAVLVDFGLVATRGLETPPGAVEEAGLAQGSALYMAPERIEGRAFDSRLDLYALGCMLFEALTGESAFRGATVGAVLLAHTTTPRDALAAQLRGVPAELARLTLALISRRAEDRPAHALSVLAQLTKYTQGFDSDGLPPARVHLYVASLVGREALLAECDRVLERARERMTLCMLRGESGVGKSRLAAEVVRRARGHKVEVLVGHCRAAPSANESRLKCSPLGVLQRPLETLVQQLEQQLEAHPLLGRETLARWFGGDDAQVLTAYVPALRRLPGHDGAPAVAPLGGDAARIRVFRAAHRVLASFVGARFLIWVLEDLQWIDELSLGFLEYLHRNPLPHAGLILGAYRSTETDPGFESFVDTAQPTLLDVSRLSEDLTTSMIRSMLGVEDIPESLARFVVRHSAGNPFFVVSCLHAAVDDGHLSLDDEGRGIFTQESALASAPMPTTLTALIERRLTSLGDTPRAVANAASVLGYVVDLELLSELVEDIDLDDALPILVSRAILEPSSSSAPGAHYRFVHEALVERLYAALSEAPRALATLHRRAANAWRRRQGQGDRVDLGQLAWHLERAGEREQAREAYFEATREAIGRYAHEEAESLIERALALTEMEDSESLSARLDFVVEVLVSQGKMEAADSWLAVILEQTSPRKFERVHARAVRVSGHVKWLAGRVEEAHQTLNRALTLATGLGDRRIEGLAYGGIGNVHRSQGRYPEALELFTRATAIAREVGDRRAECISLGNAGNIHSEQGRYPEGLALYLEAVDVARAIGDRVSEGIWLGSIASIHNERGEMGRALELFEQAHDIAREVGDRRAECVWLGNLGGVHRQEGDHAAALESFEHALEIARVTDTPLFQTYWSVEIARVHRLRGDLERARDAWTSAHTLAEATGDLEALGECWCERGHLTLAVGEAARDDLLRACAIADAIAIGPQTDLGQAIARLTRAVEAAEAGLSLYRGQRLEDFPPRVQEALRAGDAERS